MLVRWLIWRLAARFNVEAFPGVYRPLKTFLLQLADLYLFLDVRVPCLHWFNGEKNVLYIAIGADGAPFGRNDTATGNYTSLVSKKIFFPALWASVWSKNNGGPWASPWICHCIACMGIKINNNKHSGIVWIFLMFLFVFYLRAAYLVSILKILQRVQSCNDNHLLMGANSPEDSSLMKHYKNHLRREMEEVEGQQKTTPQGYQITFRIKLIPCDVKWASSMSDELNNCANYFSPFTNANQNTRTTMDGSIGGLNDTWQEWEYGKGIATAKKVEAMKAKLRDPSGKERSKVT